MNTTDNTNSGSLGGFGFDLGNGHAVLEYGAPWGRPVAQWIPGWGETGTTEIARQYEKLVGLYGNERADRIALKNRNLFTGTRTIGVTPALSAAWQIFLVRSR